MARKPKEQNDDLNELHVEGEDAALALEPVEDELPEDDDADEGVTLEPATPAARANPLDGMVSIERFNEVNGELQRTRGLVESLAARLPQSAAPAAPTVGSSFNRPNDPADVKPWRGFVGETVTPELTALEQRLQAQIKQAELAGNEQMDERDAHATIPGYAGYKADVDALRQNFYAQTGVPVPRKYAYLVVKGLREEQAKATNARSAVVKRGVAAAAPTARVPASAPRPGLPTIRSKADVAKLSFEQLEKAALGLPVS